jgi:hypothetical protein
MVSRRGETQLDVTEEEVRIPDNGGTRSGQERRQIQKKAFQGGEKRSGKDRRGGSDRRSGSSRRQTPDRRNQDGSWDGCRIERRDAFRK